LRASIYLLTTLVFITNVISSRLSVLLKLSWNAQLLSKALIRWNIWTAHMSMLIHYDNVMWKAEKVKFCGRNTTTYVIYWYLAQNIYYLNVREYNFFIQTMLRSAWCCYVERLGQTCATHLDSKRIFELKHEKCFWICVHGLLFL
jgi:hypothetical protein